MAGTVRVRHSVHHDVVAEMFSDRGRAYKDLWRRGIRVQAAAKRRLRSNPRRIDTGRLWNSIHVSQGARDGVPTVRVGTNVEYAPYVHDGTRYMRANPFLRDALKAAKG